MNQKTEKPVGVLFNLPGHSMGDLKVAVLLHSYCECIATILCSALSQKNLDWALQAVARWLRLSGLKLNLAKTEVFCLGRCGPGREIPLPVFDGAPLIAASRVKSLGVLLEPSLTMEAQIAATAKSAFFHLRRAKQLAPFLERDDLATVIHATVTSRLDYCNALYMGLPLCRTQKLQSVQNAAARLLLGLPRWEHIRSGLRDLHWLPITFRVQYKVLVITFKALYGLGPAYLRDRLSPHVPQRVLRSGSQNLLVIPGPKEARLKSTRDQAFSVTAPYCWNQLPEEVRALRDLGQCRRACKTALFRQAYNN
ncbi:uncharacterized protein LOC132575897 [Heteronotia binoei]|uniref:uncharacterized protein LOC132575897 n=1 Tax=Heteronotia binoei TaxID=13085 RepID=UPI0029317AB8|nr:uncharacterized protein LOC132575897 [Heteronotia binoei]